MSLNFKFIEKKLNLFLHKIKTPPTLLVSNLNKEGKLAQRRAIGHKNFITYNYIDRGLRSMFTILLKIRIRRRKENGPIVYTNQLGHNYSKSLKK